MNRRSKSERSKLVLATLAATLVCPSLAHAGNGTHPRTPVDWSGAPCMTIIDRSGGAVYQLSYAIPYEDTDITADEVADSRTHQFLVFCRDRHLEDILPGWITQTDVDAAAAKGLGDASFVDPEIDILETAIDWTGCWARITNDNERRPITFAEAAMPVPWDTSMLPAGSYVVDGYTYEPWYNLWTPHPGVFKIVDDPTPDANGPAAALTFGEQTVFVDDDASITGCVDAMDGATMSLSWSNGNINGEPNWQMFANDLPAPTGMFDVPFTAPIEAAGNSVMIRLDISDPMGREWTAYSRAYVAVVENVGETGCDTGASFVSNPCGTDTGTDTSTGGTGTSGATDAGNSSSETGPGIDNGGGGCSCASSPESRGPGSLLALLLLVAARRRQ